MPTYTTVTMDQRRAEPSRQPTATEVRASHASLPPFLKHISSGTVVDTATRICVDSKTEKHKIGRTGTWNYIRDAQVRASCWEGCEDPGLFWTDVFGVTHRCKEAV